MNTKVLIILIISYIAASYGNAIQTCNDPTPVDKMPEETDADKEKIGCHIKCSLSESGTYRDGHIDLKTKYPDVKEIKAFEECNEKLKNKDIEHTCMMFYEAYKCMDQLDDPWANYENVEEIRSKCGKDKTCEDKCFFETVGMLKDGHFESDNLPKDLAPMYRSIVKTKLDGCTSEMKEHYKDVEEYTCEHWGKFGECLTNSLVCLLRCLCL